MGVILRSDNRRKKEKEEAVVFSKRETSF